VQCRRETRRICGENDWVAILPTLHSLQKNCINKSNNVKKLLSNYQSYIHFDIELRHESHDHRYPYLEYSRLTSDVMQCLELTLHEQTAIFKSPLNLSPLAITVTDTMDVRTQNTLFVNLWATIQYNMGLMRLDRTQTIQA